MTRILIRLFVLLCAFFCAAFGQATTRDLQSVGEKGAAYLTSIAVAQHLQGTTCFHSWLVAKRWESLPQAFDEFSKVMITEIVLQYPNANRQEIERMFNTERVKLEKVVYQETEKFRNIQISDTQCRKERDQIQTFLSQSYTQWKSLRDTSAWEFYANTPTAPQRLTPSIPQAAPAVAAIPARKPSIDDTLEGAQRIDFFKKLLDLGVITQEEFVKKRAEILATM